MNNIALKYRQCLRSDKRTAGTLRGYRKAYFLLFVPSHLRITLALLAPVPPPLRNSDPPLRSHSRHSSPLPTAVRAFVYIARRRGLHFFRSLTCVGLCMHTAGTFWRHFFLKIRFRGGGSQSSRSRLIKLTVVVAPLQD